MVVLNTGCGIENNFSESLQYHNIELLDIPEQNILSGLLLLIDKIYVDCKHQHPTK